MMATASVLHGLQTWFQAQCNGDWEHELGVKIESTDNPGWWVKIDLRGTRLFERVFQPVTRGDYDGPDPSSSWIRCYVEDGVFNGAGDPTTLQEILSAFVEWAGEAAQHD